MKWRKPWFLCKYNMELYIIFLLCVLQLRLTLWSIQLQASPSFRMWLGGVKASFIRQTYAAKFLHLDSLFACYFRITRHSRKFLNLYSCRLLLGHSQRSEVRCHSRKFLTVVHSEVVENKHGTPRKFLHFRLSWIVRTRWAESSKTFNNLRLQYHMDSMLGSFCSASWSAKNILKAFRSN